jgi:hypothetical protein
MNTKKPDLTGHTLSELLNLRAARIRLITELQERVAEFNAEILKRQPEWDQQDEYTITPNIAKTAFHMDWKVWVVLKKTIPHQHRPTRTIDIVDDRHMTFLRTTEPAVYDEICKAVTVTPGKLTLDISLNRKDTTNGN